MSQQVSIEQTIEELATYALSTMSVIPSRFNQSHTLPNLSGGLELPGSIHLKEYFERIPCHPLLPWVLQHLSAEELEHVVGVLLPKCSLRYVMYYAKCMSWGECRVGPVGRVGSVVWKRIVANFLDYDQMSEVHIMNMFMAWSSEEKSVAGLVREVSSPSSRVPYTSVYREFHARVSAMTIRLLKAARSLNLPLGDLSSVPYYRAMIIKEYAEQLSHPADIVYLLRQPSGVVEDWKRRVSMRVARMAPHLVLGVAVLLWAHKPEAALAMIRSCRGPDGDAETEDLSPLLWSGEAPQELVDVMMEQIGWA